MERDKLLIETEKDRAVYEAKIQDLREHLARKEYSIEKRLTEDF